jgi:hypothetical protein
MCPQGVTNYRAPTLARGAIRPVHPRQRRAKPEFAESAKHLDIILKAAFAKVVPSYLAGGILPKQGFSFLGLHGSSLLSSSYSTGVETRLGPLSSGVHSFS